MDIFGKYKSQLGYQVGENQIDTYGVDHSGFTTRDEVAYQTARQQRENQIMQNYNGQGITQDYPQYGTNFWGSSPENNYGFGVSNITPNVENMQNTPVPDSLATNSQNNIMNNNIDYSLYGDDFSKEFIDDMLHDERFQNIINNRVRMNEGGYVNHPNDRGGETKYGISSRWYPNENIKNLTQERADMILFKDYWKDTNIYQLPDEIADIVLDDSIVQGQPTAIKNLQRALGIEDDGIIGPNTLDAVDKVNLKTLKERFIENVKDVEEQYLNNDPTQRVFERGHKNRFNKY